jgi:hypothetical protein
VIGAFLLPKVFTGVAETAGSDAEVARVFVVALGLAVVEAADVAWEKAIGLHSAVAPRIISNEAIRNVFALAPPGNFREFNSPPQYFC